MASAGARQLAGAWPARAVWGALRGGGLDLAFILLLIGAALPLRLANIDRAAAKSDEGIRMAQLFLMTTGLRPVRDIFASQGPLSLDATYPLFVLFGGTLAAARLAVVAYSLAELAAIYWLGRELGGRLGGLLSGLLLVTSPVYLENSRTALVEVPALLPATLAILAAVRFGASGRRRWLVGASLALALALLIKPLVLPAALPVGLELARRRQQRGRNLALATVLGGALALAVVLYAGPAQLYDQVVRYRLGSAQAEGWSIAQNLAVIADELRYESTAWLALAAVPLSLLAGRVALVPLSWAAGTLALLLVYSPLMAKHVVVLIPPAAVLVGTAAGGMARLVRRREQPVRQRAGLALVAALLGVGYAASLPGMLARETRLAAAGTDNRTEPYADEVELLTTLTTPADYILVDEPYLAFLTRRRVPPSLADPTLFRLRSGTLRGTDVIAAARAYDVRAMLLWSDGLRDLEPFGDWLDQHYRPVKIYERRNGKDRSLYLRKDVDLAAARPVLRGPLSTAVQASFGKEVRLVASGLSAGEVRAGGQITVASEWEALADLAVDYHVLGILTAPNGRTIEQTERSLGGGGAGTAAWRQGDWTIRTFTLTIPAKTPPGSYTLALTLYDSEARRVLPPDGVAGEAVPIATLTVR